MKPTSGLLLSCLLISASASATSPPPAPFAGEINEFRVQDEVRMPEPCGLLFVGSSSIRLWVGLERDFAGFNPIQRGFGGSQTSDANHYFDQLVTKYSPARIIFYEGENDINAGEPVEQIYGDLLTFLAKKDAVLGKTPVYFVAAKPSPSRANQMAAQTSFNNKVKALAAERDDLVFVDIVTPMLDASGNPRAELFIGDRLHMNVKGYQIWRTQILDALNNGAASASPNCITIREIAPKGEQ